MRLILNHASPSDVHIYATVDSIDGEHVAQGRLAEVFEGEWTGLRRELQGLFDRSAGILAYW